MKPRSSLAQVLLVTTVMLIAPAFACGDGGGGERSAVGLIVDLQVASLAEIESFTLRTNDGRTLEFRPAPDASSDPTVGLFPGHLRTHAVLGDQVEVFYRNEDGALLAMRIEDRQGLS